MSRSLPHESQKEKSDDAYLAWRSTVEKRLSDLANAVRDIESRLFVLDGIDYEE